MRCFPDPSPFHRVVVYYQTQSDDDSDHISPTPLISLATHLIIAAFHINDDKTIHLNDVSPDDTSLTQLWIDVARMQGSGVKVMGMLGGASDGSFQHLSNDFDDYYKALSSCIKSRRLDGIDLDVEVSEGSDAIVQLIKQLKTDFGEDFIVTLAPVASALKGGNNLSGFSYPDLEKSYGGYIDWYNAQFYSGYGSMKDVTDYTDIITDCPLDPSRLVAITLTNKQNGTGWVELDTVKSTVRQLLQIYGNRFGGVAGWEYYNSKPDEDEPWTWAALMQVTMVNWKEVFAAGELA